MAPVGQREFNATAGGPDTTAPQTHNLPGPAPNTAGPHRQDVLNKLDPTVDTMHGGTQVMGPGINTTNQVHSGRTGPTHTTNHATNAPMSTHGHAGHRQEPAGIAPEPQHNSKLANQLDPRVTTDSRQPQGTAATSAPISGSGPAGHHHGPVSNTHTAHERRPVGDGVSGPQHNSKLANQLDPRVDTTHAQSGAVPVSATHGSSHHGHGVPPNTMGNVPEGTHGPHSSRMANTADPRFDSDMDNRARQPAHHGHGVGNTTGVNEHGVGNTATTHNAHGLGNTTGHHGHGVGDTTVHQGPVVQPGPATKTAGPHKSNLLNKLDPSVDSKATVAKQNEYRIS